MLCKEMFSGYGSPYQSLFRSAPATPAFVSPPARDPPPHPPHAPAGGPEAAGAEGAAGGGVRRVVVGGVEAIMT